MKHLLPLSHHPKIAVVQDSNLNGQFIFNNSTKFLNIHLNTTITCNVNNDLVRASKLGAYCGGKTESHSAQAAGRYETSGICVCIILSCPHLVLADFSSDNRLAFGGLADLFNYVLWFYFVTGVIIRQAIFLLPFRNLLKPLFSFDI